MPLLMPALCICIIVAWWGLRSGVEAVALTTSMPARAGVGDEVLEFEVGEAAGIDVTATWPPAGQAGEVANLDAREALSGSDPGSLVLVPAASMSRVRVTKVWQWDERA